MTARVLGLGNRQRGDDAVGLRVVEALRERAPAGIDCVLVEGAPVELGCRWRPADRVVIVDAARSDQAPGCIRRFDALRDPLPASMFAVSTHALGLIEGIELARALGQMPAALIVYAIEGRRFEVGAPLSAAVAQAVDEAARRILDELGGPEAPDA